MLTIFNFENRFASIVKENVERILDENDLSVKSILIQDKDEPHGKESNNFFVMTSDVVDEGLAGKLIREFDWPSVGVEIPMEKSRNGFEGNVSVIEKTEPNVIIEVDESAPIKEELLVKYLSNLKYIESYEDNPLYDIFELQNDTFVGTRLIKKGYRTIRLISVKKLKEYIENGFNINLKNRDGNTELHNACEDNLVNKVKLLCESGADVNVVNNKGMTPLDTVSKLKDFPYPGAIIDILKSCGAIESNSKEGDST